MEINNNDIDDIKNDLSIIKNNIDALSLAFDKHIQEHLIASSTTQNNVNTALLDTDKVKTDVSIINNLSNSTALNDIFNTEKESEIELIKCNLIDYSFIPNSNKNKPLIEILHTSNRNINVSYQKNFLEFCSCAVALVENVMSLFLEKKFIDIEKQNNNLLKACDLLEIEYKNKPLNFPQIYIPENQYNIDTKNINDRYYYNLNKGQNLSLTNLKRADIIFTLELCFIILYGKDFYREPYIKPRSVNLQPSLKAVKRPSPKLASSPEPLNKEFYRLIDHARVFRNIIVHNKYNIEAQNKERQEQLLKKSYLKNTENNYDEILEAVTWFIRQMYFDMTK